MMTRRCVVGFVIVFLMPFSALSQQWVRQESGTMANLRGVWFVDSLNGWVCGDSGIVIRTSNSGEDWTRQISTVHSVLEDVFFWDSANGWLAGDTGVVLHTTDQGITWERQSTSVSSNLTHIRFHAPARGWVTGTRATRLRTTNWGETWQGTSGDSTSPDIDSEFWIDDVLASRSARGDVEYTHRGGSAWCVAVFPSVNRYYDAAGQRINAYPTYWFVGKTATTENEVLRLTTYDCPGQWTWQVGSTHDSLALADISLVESPFMLYAVGEKGKVVTSSDSGHSWSRLENPTLQDLRSISAVGHQLFVVGDSGAIFKTRLITSVNSENGIGEGADMPIASAYPNPTNGNITVQYMVSHPGKVSIELFDLLGKQVLRSIDAHTTPGRNSHSIDLSVLPSGFYFITVATETITHHLKALHIK